MDPNTEERAPKGNVEKLREGHGSGSSLLRVEGGAPDFGDEGTERTPAPVPGEGHLHGPSNQTGHRRRLLTSHGRARAQHTCRHAAGLGSLSETQDRGAAGRAVICVLLISTR